MKVFYRQEQAARTSSFSPSAFKPKLVLEDWLGRPDFNIEVVEFEPATQEQFALVHDAQFVRGVLSGQVANGFGNCDAAVAASLGYTTGSLVAAAEHALLHREAVCSPTSGFIASASSRTTRERSRASRASGSRSSTASPSGPPPADPDKLRSKK